MSKEYKNLQLTIDKEVYEILVSEKKKQRKPYYLIIEELVKDKYQPLKDKLKNLGE